MRNRMMLVLFVFSILGCSTSENESVEFDGVNNTYRIPVSYVKQGDSILFSEGISGDTAKSVSLLVPIDESSAEGAKDDLAVLLFLDRSYKGDEEFAKFAKNVLDGAEKANSLDGYQFIERVGTRMIEYYSSFDPYAEVMKEGSDYYFGQTIEPEVIVIPGVNELNPQSTCRVWFVEDGILVQVVALDAWCISTKYSTIVVSVSEFLNRWIVHQ